MTITQTMHFMRYYLLALPQDESFWDSHGSPLLSVRFLLATLIMDFKNRKGGKDKMYQSFSMIVICYLYVLCVTDSSVNVTGPSVTEPGPSVTVTGTKARKRKKHRHTEGVEM